MYFNRKCQMGVAVVLAVAACSDGPILTEPSNPAAAPARLAGGSPPQQEQWLVTRTIDADVGGRDRPRQAVHLRKTYTLAAGQVVVAVHGSAHGPPQPNSAAKGAPSSLDDLPLVGLSFPAARSSFRNSVVPWVRSVVVPDDPGMVMESAGVGDAPPSTIEYKRNSVVEISVSQAWEFWQGTWNLVHRETVRPDGGYREVIDVKRTGRIGGALQSPAEWARTASRGPLMHASFDLFDEESGCLACKPLQAAVMDQYQILLGTIVLAVGACAPTPLAFACLAAFTAVWAQTVKYERAVTDRDNCLSDPVRCPPKETTTTPTCSKHAGAGRFLVPALNCGSTDTGSEAPAQSGGHSECTYDIVYNLETGEIVSSQLLGCTWVADY